MSKTLKRPMFRKGGPTNGMTGIMSGIQDRKNYNVGTYPTDLGFGGDFCLARRSCSCSPKVTTRPEDYQKTALKTTERTAIRIAIKIVMSTKGPYAGT
ncbi:MAG: hypothetical protein EBV97_19415 [Rhodobacteraceae bacterium]|nr:hypothetical protein [Paracoccaceae bacterium]